MQASKTTGNGTVDVIIAVAGLFLLIQVTRAIRAVSDAVSSGLGEGDPRFFRIAELWDGAAPGYADATPAQRQRVQGMLPSLEYLAREIEAAPGLMGDDEGRALGALFSVGSRYELLWLHRHGWRSLPHVRSLGVFDPNGPRPTIGAFLDAFLDNDHKKQVSDWYASLPKYSN